MPQESKPILYRFGGVELDLANYALRVDGRVRDCPARVLKLLFLLCNQPGHLLSREFLIEHLWPGGQEVSDATLAKLLYNTRNLLGKHGDHIRTVRGQGLRLDARVEMLDSTDAHPTPETETESVTNLAARRALDTAEGRGTWRKRFFSSTSLGALVVIVATISLGAVFLQVTSSARLIDEGYALTDMDIAALEPDTAGLIQEAFKSDENGERDRAMAMLEAVHRHDTRTPIPAMFLALWRGAGAGMNQAGNSWLEEAEARLESIPDVYPNLLHDYVAAEINGTPEQVIYRAGAVLDIRPEAWRMRMARAHLMEFSGMREAALKEIQQIHIKEFAGRKYNLLIADRAAFGDVEGAQQTLDAIPPESNPVEHAFLSGRVAWSRGDFPASANHFLKAADLAYDQARLDLYRRCLIYVSAIDIMMEQDESAIAILKLAKSARGDRSLTDDIDLSLFLAQLNYERGQFDDMHTELEVALQGARHTRADQVGQASYFAAFRLDPRKLPAMPASFTPEAAALWRAMEAFTSNDTATAQKFLAEASALGIEATRMADEARWLQLQLGMPVADEQVLDPPYPPLSRVVLRRQIRNALAREDPDSMNESRKAIAMQQ